MGESTRNVFSATSPSGPRHTLKEQCKTIRRRPEMRAVVCFPARYRENVVEAHRARSFAYCPREAPRSSGLAGSFAIRRTQARPVLSRRRMAEAEIDGVLAGSIPPDLQSCGGSACWRSARSAPSFRR